MQFVPQNWSEVSWGLLNLQLLYKRPFIFLGVFSEPPVSSATGPSRCWRLPVKHVLLTFDRTLGHFSTQGGPKADIWWFWAEPATAALETPRSPWMARVPGCPLVWQAQPLGLFLLLSHKVYGSQVWWSCKPVTPASDTPVKVIDHFPTFERLSVFLA